MDSEQKRDDELAAWTDALWRGDQLNIEDEGIKELLMVVRNLHDIQPIHEEPPPALRTRLQRALGDEFDRMQRESNVIPLWQRRFALLASAAAALVLVIAALVVSGAEGGDDTAGTAVQGDILVVLGAVVAFGMAVGAWYIYQRRQ